MADDEQKAPEEKAPPTEPADSTEGTGPAPTSAPEGKASER